MFLTNKDAKRLDHSFFWGLSKTYRQKKKQLNSSKIMWEKIRHKEITPHPNSRAQHRKGDYWTVDLL